MALTDRSPRSRLSLVSTSDGGLTRVTDDSELLNASSEDFAVFQRRVRGYDPVLSYRQNDGNSFKSAPGEDEEKCDKWYRSIESYPPKTVTSRASKTFVDNHMQSTVAKTSRIIADRKRSLDSRAVAKVSFQDDTASSGRVSSVLSSTESERRRDETSRQSSGTFSDATSTFSSPSLSRKTGSSTRLSSVSGTSTGTGATVTSEQTSSTAPRRRRSHAHGRSQKKRPTTSDNSSTSISTLYSVSEESGHGMLPQKGRTGTRRRVKAKGCFAGLRNYWSDRKKRAQKEYRRKERKRLIAVSTPKESIIVKIRKYVGIEHDLLSSEFLTTVHCNEVGILT